MKQGTVSVLFGCHSVIHSLLVVIAWKKWYETWPSCWQTVCIFLHDIGHWGKDYLDDYEQKKQHKVLGARVARFLFGQKGYGFVIGHDSYMGVTKSELCVPDMYAAIIAPTWWLVSNTFFEPKLIRKGHTRRQSALMFKDAMRHNMNTGFKENGHDIYLRQWKGNNQ